MDDVLVDFQSGLDQCDDETLKNYKDREDEIPGVFSKMKPLDGAIESFELLANQYDVYILSTAPWNNPSAWTDKLLWVKKHLGPKAYKRLILTHHKNLNKGKYLIDDRDKNGTAKFDGKHLHFGEGKKFPDWGSIVNYLLP